MDNITYNVRIWKTEVYKGAKVTTHKVRWKTGDAPRGKSRSELRPGRELPQRACERRQERRGIPHRHRPPGLLGQARQQHQLVRLLRHVRGHEMEALSR